MNTTLPPSRDLPPGRHAEIRAAVLAAVEREPTRRRAAPLVAAAAAVAAIGLVAWAAPWGSDTGTQAGTQPGTPPATSTPARVPGVDAGQVPGIEEGCQKVSVPAARLTLRQVLTDQAGRLALLTTADDTTVVVCELDASQGGYNASYASLGPFSAPVTIDTTVAAAGGDVPGGKPADAGRPGSDEAAGRVSADVARVTYVRGDESVDAMVADGTFLARIVHPSDWAIPEHRPAGIVRAYDKNGTLLGEVSS